MCRSEAASGSPTWRRLRHRPHATPSADEEVRCGCFLPPYENATLAVTRLGTADRHIARLERRDLGEHRGRWSEVGRPIRDRARSASIPEVVIEVEVLNEVLGLEVGASNFVRKGAGRRPTHAHRHVERGARHKVEDRSGRAQARRGEFPTDLEIRGESRAGGTQQRRLCAVVKLADKDVGLQACAALRAVDEHKGLDTATGAVEVSKGGLALEPEHGGASRPCCMGPWAMVEKANATRDNRRTSRQQVTRVIFMRRLLSYGSRRTSLARSH
jgi:hypothetical protein